MIFIPVASLFMSEAQAYSSSPALGGGETEQSGDPECHGKLMGRHADCFISFNGSLKSQYVRT